jgi:hypothetical protein
MVEYARKHDLEGYWDYDGYSDIVKYQISTWYSIPEITDEDIKSILANKSLHWCGAFGDCRFESMLSTDYKTCMRIERIINDRPIWPFGTGLFIKKVERFDENKNLLKTHILLVYKSFLGEKDEVFVDISEDLLWFCALAPDTCQEVYGL